MISVKKQGEAFIGNASSTIFKICALKLHLFLILLNSVFLELMRVRGWMRILQLLLQGYDRETEYPKPIKLHYIGLAE
jgi:hypothetical protein